MAATVGSGGGHGRMMHFGARSRPFSPGAQTSRGVRSGRRTESCRPRRPPSSENIARASQSVCERLAITRVRVAWRPPYVTGRASMAALARLRDAGASSNVFSACALSTCSAFAVELRSRSPRLCGGSPAAAIFRSERPFRIAVSGGEALLCRSMVDKRRSLAA
ncbi:hypothetical protein Plo01_20010 [Planobispora longispora]|uniref:Uncharacterized protein n=1 Tax=Planobispora longispora TaxID=28887 RepID=A0A8J3W4A2_9ACTN|nr:hypothetical protein GCM10020093_072120 [Planobispora longispora]GIH75572.1 hypothetical protein Plo01_20010 [Planobispora longispora]